MGILISDRRKPVLGLIEFSQPLCWEPSPPAARYSDGGHRLDGEPALGLGAAIGGIEAGLKVGDGPLRMVVS